MRVIALSLSLAALMLGAAAAKTDDKVPAATPDGPPRQCLQTSQIRETRVRNDRVIDFVTNGGKVYRNTLDMPCPQLGFEKRFAYETSLSQLCSTDIITVLHEGGGQSAAPAAASPRSSR